MNDNPEDISSLEHPQFLEEMEGNCFLIRLIALVIYFFTYSARNNSDNNSLLQSI